MSKPHLLRVLAALCLVANVQAASAQRRPPILGFVDENTLERYGMTRRWFVQIPTQRVRERILALKQQEDLLFVASDRGLLHCIDSESGRILWTQTVSESAAQVYPPALTKEYVFVTSGTRLSQLERATGRIVMTTGLSSAASSGPGANETFCFVQTIDNRISAIRLQPDADEELRLWPFKRKFTLPHVQWFFDAGSRLANPPIVLRDRVLFTSANGVVFASTLDERSLYYRYIPGAPIAAPVSFRDRSLYVATVDYNLFAVDVISGKTKWRFASGYPIRRPAVPFAEDVYLTPEGGGLFALDNADGTLRWVNESPVRVVAVSQSRVYAMSSTHRFLVLDRKTGALLGGWPSNDFPVSAYNQTTDRIFLATERGLILCLAEKANETPYFHETPQTPEQTLPLTPRRRAADEEPGDEDAMPADPDDERMERDEPDDERMEAPEDDDEEMEGPAEPGDDAGEPEPEA
jgi:outer membrane protein assembly factor BamB